jgi:hypothetical protein
MLKALESLQSLLARVDDAEPPHSDVSMMRRLGHD